MFVEIDPSTIDQEIAELGAANALEFARRKLGDDARQETTEALLKRIQSGEVPGYPAMTHALLFAKSLDPAAVMSYVDRLRALNDRLVGRKGELLLLARIATYHSSATGKRRSEFEMMYGIPYRKLIMATLSGEGLKYGFRHQHDIALPTEAVVVENYTDLAHKGRFRPDPEMLEEIIFQNPEGERQLTTVVVGWSDICEFVCENHGVYIAAVHSMAQTLGVSLPEPTSP